VLDLLHQRILCMALLLLQFTRQLCLCRSLLTF
jgi:hypothetical protein